MVAAPGSRAISFWAALRVDGVLGSPKSCAALLHAHQKKCGVTKQLSRPESCNSALNDA
jgi:hypothetical protein